jgi:hypothetical protein
MTRPLGSFSVKGSPRDVDEFWRLVGRNTTGTSTFQMIAPDPVLTSYAVGEGWGGWYADLFAPLPLGWGSVSYRQ